MTATPATTLDAERGLVLTRQIDAPRRQCADQLAALVARI